MRRMLGLLFLVTVVGMAEARPVVMLTGYWEPTSEMIYRFSTNPDLNPDGWIGENWEERGYDVHAFFPAFNFNTREFEVDYQATWNDFWARVEEYRPELIISFGASNGPWEIEYRAINRTSWVADYEEPFYPTPNPPDSTIAPGASRYATLPLYNIMNAINDQTETYAWVDSNGDPGNFLCNYIAYLGMWYQNQHADEEDDYHCKGAGFIHVNADISVPEATIAAEVTLRTVLEYYENIADLAGRVEADFLFENCTISLIDQHDQLFQTNSDLNGDFLFENLQFGQYSVAALTGRYGFYQGDFTFDSPEDFLTIELTEYLPLEPLTYCAGPEELIMVEATGFVMIGAYFPPELLAQYENAHLNTLLFTAPDNSDNCMDALFLYTGNPMEGGFSPVEGIPLPDYQQGDLVETALSEMYPLTPESCEDGLTIVLGINSPDDYVGYTDTGETNPNGNLIRNGPQWEYAHEAYCIPGNWDLRLGLFGSSEAIVTSPVAEVSGFELRNYPNPFNPTTTITIRGAGYTASEVVIYNLRGQKVKTLPLSGRPGAGETTVIWNGTDSGNRQVASGVYLYRLNTPGSPLGKMLLVR